MHYLSRRCEVLAHRNLTPRQVRWVRRTEIVIGTEGESHLTGGNLSITPTSLASTAWLYGAHEQSTYFTSRAGLILHIFRGIVFPRPSTNIILSYLFEPLLPPNLLSFSSSLSPTCLPHTPFNGSCTFPSLLT